VIDNEASARAFLKRLANLSVQTGLWINGCGDCGSPYLETTNGEYDGLDNFEHIRPNDTHTGYLVGKLYSESGFEVLADAEPEP
jgi:hypothetical protein